MRIAIFLLLIAWGEIAHAKVVMPPLFSDSMVLQRDTPLNIWGTADPGEQITVTFGQESKRTVAGPDGKWLLAIAPQPPSVEGRELRIKGGNEIIFRDVLVGDVWLCSGQSNMAFLLSTDQNADTELPKASFPSLRFFRVAPTVSFDAQEAVPGKSWTRCTPDTAAKFSAVAYYFGREILQRKNIPIGLIGCYWGGTAAEAWMSREVLESAPLFQRHIVKRDTLLSEMDERMKRYNSVVLPRWQREHLAWEADSGKSPEPRKPTAPDRNPGTPTVLFNAMIHPLIRYGIKGVIWYQGEANGKTSEAGIEYASLFPALITDWRTRWNLGEFPFLFVQLAGYGEGTFFPEVRASQAAALSLPNTGMAVALDVGARDNIHPADKRTVGERLALVAGGKVYGEDIVHEGPVANSLKKDGDVLRLSYSNTGNKLTCPQGELRGFEVAGPDGKFVRVPASLEGNSIALDCREIPAPKKLRYGWAPYPESHIYNAAGLPAAPMTMNVD